MLLRHPRRKTLLKKRGKIGKPNLRHLPCPGLAPQCGILGIALIVIGPHFSPSSFPFRGNDATFMHDFMRFPSPLSLLLCPLFRTLWLLLLLFYSVFTLFIYCDVVVVLLQGQHVPRYLAPGGGRPLLTPAY